MDWEGDEGWAGAESGRCRAVSLTRLSTSLVWDGFNELGLGFV